MLVSEQRGLPAAKAVIAHRHGDRDVHPDHADLNLELELAGCTAISGEDRRAVTELVVVDEGQALLIRRDAGDGQDWPKDFVVVGSHAGLHMVQQRRVQEEAIGGDIGGAVNHHCCPFGGRAIHVAGHLVAVFAGDERAHLVGRVGTGTNLDARDSVADLGYQLVGHGIHRQHHADRHAPLTGGPVGRRNSGVGGHIQIGIRQHQHVVLGAAQGLNPLARLGARFVDVPGDGRTAHEAHGLHVWVFQEGVDRLLVTMHNVEAAIGKAGLSQQLRQEHRGGRVLLARLQNEGIAAGQGVGKHPHGHHGREVERGDSRDHAKRLTDVVHVDPGGRLLAVPALQQVRNSAGELHILEATGNLAQRIGRDLSVLSAHDVGELVLIGIDQIPEPKHHLGPPREAGGPPAGQRGLGHGNSRRNICPGSQRHLCLLLAGGRVPHHTGAG